MATYLDELVQKITTKADLKGFDDLDRKQKRAIKSNDLLAQSFRRAFGIFFGIQGIRSVIQTTRDLDLLQKSIKGLTGSVQDWQFLRQEAYRTGTSLKTIAGAYKNFYSAARGSGFNGNQIQGMFSGLLTAGRGIGASQQQIGGALVALEQMLSKGKVSAEELRKQLGNALPGAVEIAQRAMGVTGAQFEEMMKKGISAAEFVPKFIAQAEKELGKGFKENIKSLDFALVNLNTAWMEFQANILQGEAGEALAQLVRDVTKILRSQELLKVVKLFGQGLIFIIKHIKTIIALWGFNKFMKLIMFFNKGQNALKGMGLAMRLLSMDVTHLGRALKVLAGASGIGAAAKATTLLYGKWLLILGVILLIQDIIMGIFDKNADTFFNDLVRGPKPGDRGIVKGSETSIGGPVRYDPYAGFNQGDKQRVEKRIHKAWNKKDEKGKKGVSLETYRAKPFTGLTGPATPIDLETAQRILNDDIPITPNRGVVGTLPNLNGNYNSSENRKIENNISISISAPNSQPDTIAQSVEDALQNFFTKYGMSFA